jgi:uncharacterized membrane protein YphA (DoxX/SURF4 family)
VQLVHTIARVAVGIVFVVAGASKIASGRRWPAQADQFGVPPWASAVVPWAELVVGALVVVGAGQPTPIVIALVMLAVFTAVLVHSLRLGRRPPCACFGSLSATPLGWRHVARNAGFAVLAVVALVSR